MMWLMPPRKSPIEKKIKVVHIVLWLIVRSTIMIVPIIITIAIRGDLLE